ncbi:MAG TPA: serine hydrolase domain-containing protein [Polyangiaceae bacterium]|nr:serine hydrolase domain-containing protein [Polyangiaceae bacterium]
MFVTADEIARKTVVAGVAPDCAAGCAVRPSGDRARPGSATWMREIGGETGVLFDLASITKPMTAVAVARARIDRDAPLGRFLVEARDTPSEHVTIEQLLAHRAGLDAHRDLHAPLLRGKRVEKSVALRQAAQARRADAVGAPPNEGFSPVYSDLGYVLVGAALARAAGARDAGEAIAGLVLEPLGLRDRAGTVRELAARGIRGPFAPTEDVSWRGGRLCGAVHDENAWALTELGGSGHAGIFATIDAVIAFGTAFLDALDGFASALGDVDLGWLVRERAGGTLRAGFDGKSLEGSSAGARFGARSFGHLGFTGTSLWLDPDAHTVVALLTNRVCPTRRHVAIREARPAAHDALWARAHQLRAHPRPAPVDGAHGCESESSGLDESARASVPRRRTTR